MRKPDGGPFHPVTQKDANGRPGPTELGASLRDKFADTVLRSCVIDVLKDADVADHEMPRKVLASFCYAIADAMIEARNAR